MSAGRQGPVADRVRGLVLKRPAGIDGEHRVLCAVPGATSLQSTVRGMFTTNFAASFSDDFTPGRTIQSYDAHQKPAAKGQAASMLSGSQSDTRTGYPRQNRWLSRAVAHTVELLHRKLHVRAAKRTTDFSLSLRLPFRGQKAGGCESSRTGVAIKMPAERHREGRGEDGC